MFEKRYNPWNKGLKTGLIPKTAFKKGMIPWNKGMNGAYKLSSEAIVKRKEALKNKDWGTPVIQCNSCNKIFKRKLSQVKKYNIHFCSHKCMARWQGTLTGNKSHFWKGGITPLTRLIRGCLKYRQWILETFKRDNFICQQCGKGGGDLEAHHIKPFSKIIKEYKIKTLDEALNCEELWDINNGITLCLKCHQH